MSESPLRRMANVNGEITPLEDARISILDRGFLYGDSVYEVFRTYDGVPLFCHEHFDRMENSARLIHMKISQSREEMLEEMRRTAAAANVPKGTDIYVRWHVTRGSGALDLVPARDLVSTFVIILEGGAEVEAGVLLARHAIGGDLCAAQSGRGAEPGYQERQLSQQHLGRGRGDRDWGRTIV